MSTLEGLHLALHLVRHSTLMDAPAFTLQHRTLGDEHIDVCCIFLKRRKQVFSPVTMLTIVARMPDALAIGFDKKHVGVIDAMTVGERSHPDIAYTDAFADDIRRLMLPDPHPVNQPAFALGLFAMVQSIAALLRVTFPCKEFMDFKVCSLTDDII